MKKILLSALLCFCVIFVLMPTVAYAADATEVFVGGVRMNATDMYLINGATATDSPTASGANESNYNAKFVPAGDTTPATLTLRNFNYKGAGYSYAAIYAGGDLTIVLEGSSSVTHSGNNSYNHGICCYGALSIRGNGSLEVSDDSTNNMTSVGIECYAITVSGNAKVTAVGGKAPQYSYGINCWEKGTGVIITGNATVTATGGTSSGLSYGISSSSGASVTVSGNATVTATGGKAPQNSKGISCKSNGTSVTITDSATVTATGDTSETGDSNGIDCVGITVSGNAAVTATGGKARQNSSGISCSLKVTVSDNATVSATGGTDGVSMSYGISCSDATISGNAAVTATGGKAGINSYGIECIVKVNVSDDASVTATGGTVDDSGNSCGFSTPYNALTVSGGAVKATGTVEAFANAPIISGYLPADTCTVFAGNDADSAALVSSPDLNTFKNKYVAVGPACPIGVNGEQKPVPAGRWTDEENYDADWLGDYENNSMWIIRDEADLAAFANAVNEGNTFKDKYVTVAADLDMSSHIWTAIGDVNIKENRFMGVFDGGEHNISGLYYKGSNKYIGLFETLYGGGTIIKVNVTNCYLSNSNSGTGVNVFIGGIVSYNLYGSITGCSSSGTIITSGSSVNSAGGIAGYNHTNTITDCYSSVNISASGDMNSYIGGITGKNYGIVINCGNTGNVSADIDGDSIYIGGITGINYSKGTVADCYNTGNVSANCNYKYFIGGIAGYNYATVTVTNCYNTGNVSNSLTAAVELCAGGIVGENYGDIINCYNTDEVSTNYRCDRINIGGIAGKNYGNIINCYNTGDVSVNYRSSTVYIGGIAGINYFESTVTNCYNTGDITFTNDCAICFPGGVVGHAPNNTITNCYYKKGTAGSGIGNSISDTKGVTTAIPDSQMKASKGEPAGEDWVTVTYITSAGVVDIEAPIPLVALLNNITMIYNNSNPEIAAREWAQLDNKNNGCPVFAVNATVNLTDDSFDIYNGSEDYTNKSYKLSPGTYYLKNVMIGDDTLTEDMDYIVWDDVVTISMIKLSTLTPGNYTITFVMNDGTNPTVDLTVTDSTPANITVAVSASPREGGRVTGGGTFKENTQCTVKATPKTNYVFVRWTEDGREVSRRAEYKFTVTENRKLVAEFKYNPPDLPPAYNYCMLTFESNGGSAVEPIVCIQYFNLDISGYIPTREGYIFTGWYSDSALTNKVTVINMLRNATVYAGWAIPPSMGHFQLIGTYSGYLDVDESCWYGTEKEGVIRDATLLGLMDGYGNGNFGPDDELKVGEAVKIACKIHSIYVGDGYDFTQGEPWYDVYVDYAIANGIIAAGEFEDYTAVCTRAQAAYIFAHALPEQELTEIWALTPPDVDAADKYSEEIYLLYAAGILRGNDDEHTFGGDGTFTRAQAAAIATRLCLPENR